VRRQRVKIGDVLSDSLQLSAGMPQGSYLGTLTSWGVIHERWSHVRYDIGRTTDVVATIRPIHESSRKK